MKRIYRCCLCILIAFGVARGVASAQEEWMPDPNLRQAVREKLNLPGNKSLTVLHLERLHDLVILESDVADLQGLEHAANLGFLHLSNSKIADLTPLANLVSLKVLKLYNNKISDVSPLANLTNLEELNLSQNHISNLHPLVSLQNLVTLNVVDNPIYDFSPLFGLTNLQSIQITWETTIDVTTLQRLMVEVGIPDPNLQQAVRGKLNLPQNIPLTVLHLERLYDLVIVESDIANLQGLEHAVNLHFLHLSSSQIVDLTPLANLGSLEVLKLYDNEVSDITPLANLRKLKELNLSGNQITDFTPLLELRDLEVLYVQGNPGDITPLLTLNLAGFQVCDVERLPNAPRIKNREYPSVFAAWANIINLSTLTESERLARHDLYFCCPMFGLGFVETGEGIRLVGDVGRAMEQRELLKKQNPNLVLLVGIQYYSGVDPDAYPEDSPLWLRDEKGARVIEEGWNESLLDFTKPIVQKLAIQQAVAVSKCGLFDGIFLDHWNENPRLRGYQTLEAEHTARDTILQQIRAEVGDDFLIMVNSNHSKVSRWAPYINGLFMETFGDVEYPQRKDRFEAQGYTYSRLQVIESTLTWAENHLKDPQINGLEGFGISRQTPDSPTNQRWMRVFTTMSLTHSDGYVLYNIGNASKQHSHTWNNRYLDKVWGHFNSTPHVHDHDHYWYPFWNADLGKPIGEKAGLYQNRKGLFIREFTNGWAVYNRSGSIQEIHLPEQATGVESGLLNSLHTLPDLDGEIYLKRTTSRHDVNEDGVINILDLVAVAGGFGKDTPDVNGDGIVNILDLVAIANAF